MTDFNFMNNPDFGAPGGIRADQAAQMNALSMQGAQAELNMMPDKQAHLRAQTQHLQAQTGAIPSEIELRRATASKAPAEIMKIWSEVGKIVAETDEKTFATQEAKALKDALIAASEGGQFAVDTEGKPVSQAKAVINIGMQLLKRFPNAAEKMLNQGNLMFGHETSEERLAHDKRKAALEQDLKMFDLVGHRTPWITNQQQLDDLTADVTKQTGKPPPWAGLAYSPELVRALNASSLKYSERANFQLREEKAVFDQRQREFRNNLDKLRYELDKDKLARQRERDARDKKAGAVAPAGASDVDAVTQMLIQQNPKLKGLTGQDAAAFDQFSRSVADEAKRLYKQADGALTPEQARYKAMTDNMDQLTVGSNWGSTTVKYESKGIGTAKTPIPFAADAERKEGKWYTVNGRVVQWAKNPATGQMGWKAAE